MTCDNLTLFGRHLVAKPYYVTIVSKDVLTQFSTLKDLNISNKPLQAREENQKPSYWGQHVKKKEKTCIYTQLLSYNFYI